MSANICPSGRTRMPHDKSLRRFQKASSDHPIKLFEGTDRTHVSLQHETEAVGTLLLRSLLCSFCARDFHTRDDDELQ